MANRNGTIFCLILFFTVTNCLAASESSGKKSDPVKTRGNDDFLFSDDEDIGDHFGSGNGETSEIIIEVSDDVDETITRGFSGDDETTAEKVTEITENTATTEEVTTEVLFNSTINISVDENSENDISETVSESDPETSSTDVTETSIDISTLTSNSEDTTEIDIDATDKTTAIDDVTFLTEEPAETPDIETTDFDGKTLVTDAVALTEEPETTNINIETTERFAVTDVAGLTKVDETETSEDAASVTIDDDIKSAPKLPTLPSYYIPFNM